MDKREEVIEYLQRKGKIQDDKIERPKFSKIEEDLIKRVRREGRIFGDPLVEIY